MEKLQHAKLLLIDVTIETQKWSMLKLDDMTKKRVCILSKSQKNKYQLLRKTRREKKKRRWVEMGIRRVTFHAFHKNCLPYEINTLNDLWPHWKKDKRFFEAGTYGRARQCSCGFPFFRRLMQSQYKYSICEKFGVRILKNVWLILANSTSKIEHENLYHAWSLSKKYRMELRQISQKHQGIQYGKGKRLSLRKDIAECSTGLNLSNNVDIQGWPIRKDS